MNFWNALFNLRRGEERKEAVLRNVKASISFRGSNLWILACAILVASVGLNVNSTAVIIGAMLISPLMGPIVGAGFALGIFDFNLLKRSLANLLLATLVGLAVSFLYFWATPFKDAQSELIARTAPNIYDVLIAFFGGLAGVIAITRVEKGNPIPGVAIATALMPPLCTAGYGLAIGRWDYFGGALFLYSINCVFICIATYLIVKFLRYPAKIVDEKQSKRVNWIVTALTFLLILPSVYFAYEFFRESQYKKSVQDFVSEEFEKKGNTVIFQKVNYQSNPRKIELAFLTRRFTASEIAEINKRLPLYHLNATQLMIRQDSAFLAEKKSNPEIDDLSGSKDKFIIAELKSELDKYTLGTEAILEEAKVLFPEMQSLSIGRQAAQQGRDSALFLHVALYQSEKPLSDATTERLRHWLKVRLKSDSLEIYRKP